MCELGNTVINQIYEGACEELGAKKPGPSSSRYVLNTRARPSLYIKLYLYLALFFYRQEKEAWIKSKYVEKRFLKKLSGSEALVEGERKSRPWTVKKCHRHSSSVRAPHKARRKYHRYEPGSASPANLTAG